MRYGSVCSGIEAATAAWHSLGWEPAFFSEIEAFPRAVLKHHYPDTPIHGDFTTIGENDYEPIDLLVGGTPCQSFSIAGLRGGMDDDRGNLALEFIKLAHRRRVQWITWENVPGVFSSNAGEDFRCFLSGLAGWNVRLPADGWKNSGIITPAPGGFGLCWRVLDAQYFGVAQRRRRVFVVGYIGDWRPAAAVLFERHSLQGHSAPSREKSEDVANCLGASPAASSQPNVGNGQGNVVVQNDEEQKWPAEVAATMNAAFASKMGLEDQHAFGGASYFVLASGQAGATVDKNISPTLNCNRDGAPIAFNIAPGKGELKEDIHITLAETSKTLDAAGSNPALHQGGAIILQPQQGQAIAFKPGQSADAHSIGAQEEVACTLESGGGGNNRQAVAYSVMPMNSGKDYKARETEVAQPIMANGPVGGNQGGDYVVAYSEDTARTLSARHDGSHCPDRGMDVVAVRTANTSANGHGIADEVAHTLDQAQGQAVYIGGIDYENNAHTMDEPTGPLMKGSPTGGGRPLPAIAFTQNQRDELREVEIPGSLSAQPGMKQQTYIAQGAVAFEPGSIARNAGPAGESDLCPTLRKEMGDNQPAVRLGTAVRRLTPTECERLQGFPDGYTSIPWRGKPADQCPDGPRYKALGNSMAVPCMVWIGQRIQSVEDIING